MKSWEQDMFCHETCLSLVTAKLLSVAWNSLKHLFEVSVTAVKRRSAEPRCPRERVAPGCLSGDTISFLSKGTQATTWQCWLAWCITEEGRTTGGGSFSSLIFTPRSAQGAAERTGVGIIFHLRRRWAPLFPLQILLAYAEARKKIAPFSIPPTGEPAQFLSPARCNKKQMFKARNALNIGIFCYFSEHFCWKTIFNMPKSWSEA